MVVAKIAITDELVTFYCCFEKVAYNKRCAVAQGGVWGMLGGVDKII